MNIPLPQLLDNSFDLFFLQIDFFKGIKYLSLFLQDLSLDLLFG